MLPEQLQYPQGRNGYIVGFFNSIFFLREC